MRTLLTVYPYPDHMRLLVKNEDGKHEIIQKPYTPHFYAIAKEPQRIAHILSQHPLVKETGIEIKRAHVSDLKEREVVRIDAFRQADIEQIFKDASKLDGIEGFAQRGIAPDFVFAIENGLRYFENYENSKDEKNEHLPLILGAIMPSEEFGKIIIKIEGKEEVEIGAKSIGSFLEQNTVDVLFSSKGDKWAGKAGIRAKWEQGAQIIENTIHIDIKTDISNDIYASEDSKFRQKRLKEIIAFGKKRLSRIKELCSLTFVRPEIASRVTPGRLNTYLHARVALQKGILIPDEKALFERPKSLKMLGALDKGGLIFYPRPGAYSNVAKCDFSSMYPSIIVNNNISPETMQCKCNGKKASVPSSGWEICTEHEGLIPKGLREVLQRRLKLKAEMKKEIDLQRKEDLDRRQRALKNILVTCFGYLGYNHFVFSNVEAKEAVMLYGRLAMEKTHEIAHKHRLEVIYGIVDSVFVKAANGAQSDEGNDTRFRAFALEVGKEIGIELSLEGVFDCVVFPKTRQGGGAGSRYWGKMRDGTIECRGIALRRQDCPKFIFEFQNEAMERALANKAKEPDWGEVEAVREEYEQKLRKGDFSLDELAILCDLSKPIEEYKSNAPHVKAAKDFFGESGEHDEIRFVYTLGGAKQFESAKDEKIDAEKYVEILQRAKDELRC